MAGTRRAATTTSEQQTEFVCPECGKSFNRAASLGAHRRRAHGVAGATAQSKPRARRRSRSAAATTAGSRRAAARRRETSRTAAGAGNGRIDRDALLQTLFPGGVPAREEVIHRANAWLDEAEQLAAIK